MVREVNGANTVFFKRFKKCEASPRFRAGGLPYGSASQPGKEASHFYKAPLDPALPGGACGEQAGQLGKKNQYNLLTYGKCYDSISSQFNTHCLREDL